MKKKIIIVLLIVIAVVGFNLSLATKKVDRLLAEDVDVVKFSEIEEGTYTGKYDAGLVKVELEVEVINNEVKDINITKHTNGKGKPGENVVSTIIKKQSLQVDTVAGATISSKAIIKAVEDALTN